MRPISDDLRAALKAGLCKLRLLVRAVLPSGAYNASDHPLDFSWDGNDYRGFGAALGIELPTSGTDTLVSPVALSLSATDPEVLATFYEEDYRGSPAEAAALFYVGATGRPVGEWPIAKGVLDFASDSIGAGDPLDASQPVVATLKVSLAPQAAELKRIGARVASDADQRTFRDPLDGFFKDVGQAPYATIYWGVNGASSPASAAPASNLPSGYLPAPYLP